MALKYFVETDAEKVMTLGEWLRWKVQTGRFNLRAGIWGGLGFCLVGLLLRPEIFMGVAIPRWFEAVWLGVFMFFLYGNSRGTRWNVAPPISKPDSGGLAVPARLTASDWLSGISEDGALILVEETLRFAGSVITWIIPRNQLEAISVGTGGFTLVLTTPRDGIKSISAHFYGAWEDGTPSTAAKMLFELRAMRKEDSTQRSQGYQLTVDKSRRWQRLGANCLGFAALLLSAFLPIALYVAVVKLTRL